MYITGSSDNRLLNTGTATRRKVGAFHEAFCKTVIDLEMLTRVTSNANQPTGTSIGIGK